MRFCNIINGSGWERTGVFDFGQPMQARLMMVVAFFVIAIARKHIPDFFGLEWDDLFGWGAYALGYLITISISCSPKLAFIVSIIAGLAGGFGFGYFRGGY